MKRAIFLATIALLAMLILVPMALTQEESGPSSPFPSTFITGAGAGGGGMPQSEGSIGLPTQSASGTPQAGGGGGLQTPVTGGPPVYLLPAAALLLGSGILTYAVLRRR